VRWGGLALHIAEAVRRELAGVQHLQSRLRSPAARRPSIGLPAGFEYIEDAYRNATAPTTRSFSVGMLDTSDPRTSAIDMSLIER